MTDSDDVAAFRAALSGALGSPRLVPATETPDWRADWSTLKALDVPVILDPVEGGGEDGLRFAVVAAQTMATALHPFPGHAVLPVAELGQRLEPALGAGAGEAVVALAFAGPQTRVVPDGTGALVSGVTLPVAGIEGLTHLLLYVETRPAELFLVDLSVCRDGVEDEATLDLSRTYSRVHLADVPALVVSDVDAMHSGAVSRMLVAADTAALATSAVHRTVDYARDRVTFGNRIGGYQAVQHRLVENAVAARQMEDLVQAAVAALSEGVPEAEERVLVAETFCHERGASLISDCVQLTGAIAFTWEYGLHHALRRAGANAQLVGGARRARSRLAEVAGW